MVWAGMLGALSDLVVTDREAITAGKSDIFSKTMCYYSPHVDKLIETTFSILVFTYSIHAY